MGGNGAIVNNFNPSTAGATTNFQNILLTTNTVFGGNARYDIRADFSSNADCTLSTGGQPFNLTKIGSNQFQIGGVIMDSALANIYVEQTNSHLGLQWTCVIGNPTNSLVISNSAFVQLFDVSNVLNKVLLLYNNGALTNAAGSNEFDGPVTLAAGNGILSSGAGTLAMANEISGPGNLVKLGGSPVLLSLTQTNSGAEIYTGNTIVQQGALILLDSVVLTNSPIILVSNGATLATTGAITTTLTLGSLMPQTLQGGGTIVGPLVENANSTVMGKRHHRTRAR